MINIYRPDEIEIMREGGKILAKIIKILETEVRPGITTKYLDKVAEDLIFKYEAQPSFKGFNNYPAALCASINEEIVHAVPSERKLKKGDILSLDLGIKHKGYCTDMAVTMPILDPTGRSGRTRVGRVDRKVKKLIDVTKKSLELGIKQAKPGNHLEDIGWAIQNYVEKQGFNVVRELVGHGVGKKVHEDPQITNYGERGKGPELKEGMILALEPMVTVGDWRVEKTKDGFGYKTKDNSLSAHSEHTVAITKKGPLVLTKL